MTDTDKPQDQRDIDARAELEQPRDAWAESAARTCVPENKAGIIWALANVLREFDHLIGDGPHTDRACDTIRDAISAVMATYDKHAKLARPAPEALGAAKTSGRLDGDEGFSLRVPLDLDSIERECNEGTPPTFSETLAMVSRIRELEALGAAGVELSDAEILRIFEKETGFSTESNYCIVDADILGFTRAILAKSKGKQS